MRPVETAQVIYDSAGMADMTGARGGPRKDRSLVFCAETVSMDLMVQPRKGNRGLFLCGQVIEQRMQTPIPGIELRIGGDKAFADAYGQFAVAGSWPPEDRSITVVTKEADVVCHLPTLD